MTEMVLIAVVALIIFGPRKLPEIARQIGKAMNDFKRVSSEFRETWEKEVAFENEINIESRNNKVQTIAGENTTVNRIGTGFDADNTSLVEFENRVNAEKATEAIALDTSIGSPLIKEIDASQFGYIENKSNSDEINNNNERVIEESKNANRKRDWL